MHDRRLPGWSEGPFVDLDLALGLPPEPQVARLLAEIHAIRAAVAGL